MNKNSKKFGSFGRLNICAPPPPFSNSHFVGRQEMDVMEAATQNSQTKGPSTRRHPLFGGRERLITFRTLGGGQPLEDEGREKTSKKTPRPHRKRDRRADSSLKLAPISPSGRESPRWPRRI